ncbi:Beta tubulin, autoregulation binding site [Penicillium camemberti]|uniref:Beta tubulin, autoregulation binding site n=1 Tax=Penicillium camemberti (strain FM 013) TaxID=1429867 RepID=A0A0G4PWB8_PENC3|nr:Beta tubulin, autoregulation binding site [Penicillium camemberti]
MRDLNRRRVTASLVAPRSFLLTWRSGEPEWKATPKWPESGVRGLESPAIRNLHSTANYSIGSPASLES